jgi:ribosome-interacting GTPase 1
VSAVTGRRLDDLRNVIFDSLQLIRVYAKPPGEDPDLSTPFVLQMGGTVADFASKVHLDFYKNLKHARVWGTGVFDGQMVGREHELHDGDIVELRM